MVHPLWTKEGAKTKVSDISLNVCRPSYGKALCVSVDQLHLLAMTQLPDF